MGLDLPTEATLECDNCNETTEVDLTIYAGFPPTVGFDDDDPPEGWIVLDGEYYCPSCADKLGDND